MLHTCQLLGTIFIPLLFWNYLVCSWERLQPSSASRSQHLIFNMHEGSAGSKFPFHQRWPQKTTDTKSFNWAVKIFVEDTAEARYEKHN